MGENKMIVVGASVVEEDTYSTSIRFVIYVAVIAANSTNITYNINNNNGLWSLLGYVSSLVAYKVRDAPLLPMQPLALTHMQKMMICGDAKQAKTSIESYIY